MPVDLAVIHDLYDVEYLRMPEELLGFAFATKKTQVVKVNERLHRFGQRMVLAHEISHLLLGHPNALYLCEVGDWWYSRIEVEAQKGAAILLIPEKPLVEMARRGYSVREMQDFFEVPGELIELGLRMANRIV